MDGEEFEATLVIRIRPEYEGDHVKLAKRIAETIGTFMVDTSDWRFQDLDLDDRDAIIEIYANSRDGERAMSEPISDSTLQLYRRRFEGLDEFMQNLEDKERYDPMEIIKECMKAARCVPLLLDEITRLKGESHG